jgi:hypothetical protein
MKKIEASENQVNFNDIGCTMLDSKCKFYSGHASVDHQQKLRDKSYKDGSITLQDLDTSFSKDNFQIADSSDYNNHDPFVFAESQSN